MQGLCHHIAEFAKEATGKFPDRACNWEIEYVDHLSTLRLVVDNQVWIYSEMGSDTFTIDRILTQNGKRQGLRIAENIGRETAVNLLKNMALIESYVDGSVITTFENNDPETAEFIRQLLESQAAKSLPV